MRFVTSRWSLSAAGLISALALAACSTTPAPIAPAPMPVMAPTAPMMAPAMHARKKWVKKHRRGYSKKKKMRKMRKVRRYRARR